MRCSLAHDSREQNGVILIVNGVDLQSSIPQQIEYLGLVIVDRDHRRQSAIDLFIDVEA